LSGLREKRKTPQDAARRRKTPPIAADPMKNVKEIRHNDSEMR